MHKDKIDFNSTLKKGDIIVRVNPNYYRPTEVDFLIGDSSKANKMIGWKARTKFANLVEVMIKADMEKVLRRGF
jgi:GDPmannose 4,6-dehydratase